MKPNRLRRRRIRDGAAPDNKAPGLGARSGTEGRLLSRLLGMETEYAPLFVHGGTPKENLPSARAVYLAIANRIRRDQPTAEGIYDQDQIFLASGGAVSFESHPALHGQPGGLIEIATPEVRSVRELVACQRSIDELIADAAASADLGLEVRVLKNSSDALGHVYGCQENYETVVASGLGLLVYRAFVMLLWMMQLISFVVAVPLLLAVAAFSIFRRSLIRQPAQPATASDVFAEMPPWLIAVLIGSLRLLHLPTVGVLKFVANHVAFRAQRKYLTALLVSRVALASAGELDAHGRFRLSAKAMAIDSVADMGGFRWEKPIFVYGHWLSQLCAKSFISLSATRQLLRRKQRLQIGLSDSNLCDLAEYVKVGSVALVLDMIERGKSKSLPQLRRPLWSLQRIARDWNLISRVPTSQGELSAIQIQQVYLREATHFVASIAEEDRGEATEVIARWEEAVGLLVQFRRHADAIEPALGRIDWLSKLWMLRQLDPASEWAVRKKVDLKYHELSSDGYHQRLLATQPELRLVTNRQVDRRRRTPPSDSPAAHRGWLIREFAGLDDQLRAEWGHAVVQDGPKMRRVLFTNDPSSPSS